MSEFTGICDSQCVHKGLLLIRVRGFPARDILSLCALGDGIGQDNKKNCRRVAVGVIFLSARFSQEKLHKMMFL